MAQRPRKEQHFGVFTGVHHHVDSDCLLVAQVAALSILVYGLKMLVQDPSQIAGTASQQAKNGANPEVIMRIYELDWLFFIKG